MKFDPQKPFDDLSTGIIATASVCKDTTIHKQAHIL
jgi:hypothetical protein